MGSSAPMDRHIYNISPAPKDEKTLEKKEQNDLKSQRSTKLTVRLLHPSDVKEDALIIPQWYGFIKKSPGQ